MSIFYVKEQGSYIKKSGEHLNIEKNNQVLMTLPIHAMSSLSVIGNVQVTTQALQAMMKEGIDINYFSYSGELLGSVSSNSSKNIFLRFNQYTRYLNQMERIEIARDIVRGKINNQIKVLERFHWETVAGNAKEELHQLKQLVPLIDTKKTNNQLMGIEGSAGNIYFANCNNKLDTLR